MDKDTETKFSLLNDKIIFLLRHSQNLSYGDFLTYKEYYNFLENTAEFNPNFRVDKERLKLFLSDMPVITNSDEELVHVTMLKEGLTIKSRS